MSAMKYELEPYHRGVSDDEFLADLRAVAAKLCQRAVTKAQYQQHGAYHPSSLVRRFGTWFDALASAGLAPTRNLKVSEEECLADLKRVAQVVGKPTVTQDEYRSHGKFSPAPLIRNFGSWFGALSRAGLERTRVLGITDDQYFSNIEQLWRHFGRQPRYAEVSKPLSAYSAGAYERRFGSWRKALHAFINYIEASDTSPEATPTLPPATVEPAAATSAPGRVQESSRYISLRVRFFVMRRDGFKCAICGRSPATHPGLCLHVDHIVPWSKSGQNSAANLQTLCEACNLGKSDSSMSHERPD
jgi:hypothetical protein